MKQLSRNSSGQALVQILVATGIMGILMMAMVSMFVFQGKEAQSLKERLAVSDFQQQLIRSFADGSLCSSVFSNPAVPTFNTADALAGATQPA